MLKGTTKKALHAFKANYLNYKLKLDQANDSRAARDKFVPVSVVLSLDSKLFRHLCRFEWDTMAAAEITDAFILEWIEKQLSTDSIRPINLEMSLSSVSFNEKERDSSARCLKFFGDIEDVIETEGLTAFFIEGDGQKQLIKTITPKIRPQSLLSMVRSRLSMVDIAAKSDFIKFYKLVLAVTLQHDEVFNHQVQHPSAPTRQKKTETTPTPTPTPPAEKTTAPTKKPTVCFHCGKAHNMRECPTVTEAERSAIREKLSQCRRDRVPFPVPTIRRVQVESTGFMEISFASDSSRRFLAKTDSGCDEVCAPFALFDDIVLSAEPNTAVEHLDPPREFRFGGENGPIVHAKAICHSSLILHTTAGPLKTPEVDIYFIDSALDILLGDRLLRELGIDIDQQLASLAARELNSSTNEDEIEDPDCIEFGSDDRSVLQSVLHGKVKEAVANGLPIESKKDLVALVNEFEDIFCIKLGPNPPVKVEPVKVHIKADFQPPRCSTRSYSPSQMAFMTTFYTMLCSYGMFYTNSAARFASPAHPVRKHGYTDGVEFRATTDYKAVNMGTEDIQYPMPLLPTLWNHLAQSRYFFKIDLFKGYFQIPLAECAQEFFSVMTHDGVYTPRRLPQGVRDAVLIFQAVITDCLKDHGLLYVIALAWLDDLLGHARTMTEYFIGLRKCFVMLREFGFKLNAQKCVLFATQVEFYGRIHSAAGISHHPERISALARLPPPSTAADLQQFISACNWMRNHMANFSGVFKPLMDALQVAFESSTSTQRSKRAAAKIPLHLNKIELAAFHDAKALLQSAATLAYPDPTQVIHVFTDASSLAWGALITQVPLEDMKKPVDQRNHKPVTFLSGIFRGASLNWSIVDKECFALVTTLQKFRHWLLAVRFHVFVPCVLNSDCGTT